MTEREFLIQLAVNHFNDQYHRSISALNCDIKSITPNQFSLMAYEIFTTRLDDHVRLRIYLNFNNFDTIDAYRLEVDGSDSGTSNLTDEIYVATGFVDSFYRDSGLYKFHWLGENIETWAIMLDEDGNGWITEDTEDYFLLEYGA